jgi:hypothetical protein
MDPEVVDYAKLIREALESPDENVQMRAAAELARRGIYTYPPREPATLTRAESTP